MLPFLANIYFKRANVNLSFNSLIFSPLTLEIDVLRDSRRAYLACVLVMLIGAKGACWTPEPCDLVVERRVRTTAINGEFFKFCQENLGFENFQLNFNIIL